MTQHTTALFTGLFDDAALFPPGDAPMTAAVLSHQALQAGLGEFAGPFVVPAARLDELSASLGDGPPIRLSLIAAATDLPSAAARVADDARLVLAGLEVPVTADPGAARTAVRAVQEVLPTGVPSAIEVPRSAARDDVLDVLAGTGIRAKLRTGGLEASQFPSPAELAASLSACIQRGIAFKCTAGLHHAVRHTDGGTGLTHHGFINVMVAVSALTDGGSAETAAERLSRTDAGHLTAALKTWSPQRVARVRAAFTSFGTCSVLEPVEDLVGLGLLPLGEAIPA